ncbi:hypothetical protein VPH35_057414 [Triticum aestivum]
MARHWLLALVSLLLLLQTPSISSLDARGSDGSCVAHERAALLSFKGSLSDPVKQLSSWHGEDCCTWEGVGCSNRTGHVVNLNLSGCGYEARVGGDISPSLTALHHLKYLDLSCNNFSGVQIPKFVASLKSLQHLDLSFASFVGRVPPQLGNLSNLVFLSVSDNPLYSDDLAWLSHLTSLQYLDMSSVNLSTSVDWVHAINKLPSLKVLCLEDSDLRKSPATLSHYNLTALRVLDISGNTFQAAFSPSWVWHITTLTYLDLSQCDFRGSIPDEMGSMTSLEEVHIAEANLAGIIPPNLKNLCNLKIVDLHDSNTTGDIGELMERLPKCSWDKLYVLDFSDNNISGSLPNWFRPLTNLTILDLSYNYITGPVPLWIGALPKLAILHLHSNQLVGEINEDHLEGLRSLQELRMSDNSVSMVVRSDWVPSFRLQVADLKSCRIGPAFPAWLRCQSDIQVIDISNASITDNVPDWFWTLASNATLLDMSNNQINGTLPASFETMKARIMDLSANRFTGAVPKFPRGVTFFDLSRNKLSGTLPSDWEARELSVLALYNNSISGNIPSSLCNYSLEILDLSGNMLTGEVPTCQQGDLGGFTRLRSLNLNSNNLSGNFPSVLQRSKDMIFLDLAYNQLSGNLPARLVENMTSLALLRLRSNMFSGHIPVELAKIEGLQYLDLACNNFSGGIPESLAKLKAIARINGYSYSLDGLSDYSLSFLQAASTARVKLSYTTTLSVLTKGQQLEFSKELPYMVNIDLSCNNLTGGIPEGISALIALKSLNFSWNHLTGRIPKNIGNLKALESLDLSHNELSGEIPSSISAITSLSRFNLSYNNLSGQIPAGNQLQALDDRASSYIGNIGLCGPPLLKSCSPNATIITPATDDGDHHHGVGTSIYLSMVVGFVFGLWVVFCVMLFKKRWRYAYFRFTDNMYHMMRPCLVAYVSTHRSPTSV